MNTLFPYGGTPEDLSKLSKKANLEEEDKYKKTKSLLISDILDQLNSALVEISQNPNIYTVREHLKVVSLAVVCIAILGLFLYEFERYAFRNI
jgi:hypothetical protein